MDLLELKQVDLVRTPPQIGDLLVCGGCGFISKVSLTGTMLITEPEYEALSYDEKRDLTFAQRAIKRNLRAN
jgi:hypothetical protein